MSFTLAKITSIPVSSVSALFLSAVMKSPIELISAQNDARKTRINKRTTTARQKLASGKTFHEKKASSSTLTQYIRVVFFLSSIM
jgi:hypothetical protein